MNRNKVITVALIISVAFNILIVGIITGRIMSNHEKHHGPPLSWMLRDIDEQTRRELKPALIAQAKLAAPLHQEIAAARDEFRQQIEADQFDKLAAQQSLLRLRTASTKLQQTLHQQMLVVLEDLDPVQRRKVARALMRPGPEARRRPPPG